jgi:hypothetical protein
MGCGAFMPDRWPYVKSGITKGVLCRSHITTERRPLSLNPFAIHLPYSFMTARLSARSFGEFSPIAFAAPKHRKNLQKYSIAFFAGAALVALATVACGGDSGTVIVPTQLPIAERQTQIASTPNATTTPEVVIVTPTDVPLEIYADGILEVHHASGWLNSNDFKIGEKLPTTR